MGLGSAGKLLQAPNSLRRTIGLAEIKWLRVTRQTGTKKKPERSCRQTGTPDPENVNRAERKERGSDTYFVLSHAFDSNEALLCQEFASRAPPQPLYL